MVWVPNGHRFHAGGPFNRSQTYVIGQSVHDLLKGQRVDQWEVSIFDFLTAD